MKSSQTGSKALALNRFSRPGTGEPLSAGDGIPWEAWLRGAPAEFGVHPDGFAVFVPASDAAGAAQYEEEDSYKVAGSIESPFHRRRFEDALHLLRKTGVTGPGACIIDAGCGEGDLTEHLRRAVPGSEMWGFDSSIPAIQEAVRRFEEIQFAVADAHSIPRPSGSADVVVCTNLLEHVPSPVRLLSEFRRLLKRDGYLILSTPSRFRFENLLRSWAGLPVVFMSNLHVTEYTVDQVVELLRFGGFRTVCRLSTPVTPAEWSWKWRLAKRLLTWWMRRTHSAHVLESTVFFLAQVEPDSPRPT
ncbi:MAG: class I SAM-dependent methyltransferase [Bryobacterales bacterium]|nr:class I SAM-dependent methyltransferase [Bryobacterales bacterium]